MPRGDRTGPNGMGSMTGRGAGYCTGNGMPGYANPGSVQGMGFGFGRGGGRGRGCRNWFGGVGGTGFNVPVAPYQSLAPEAEKQALKNQAEMLQTEMANIKKRLEEMELGKTSE
jgi:uncharacterized protein DUF5320